MSTKKIASFLALLLLTALHAAPAHAGVPVKVTVTGTVVSNQINPPPLGNANVGDPATLVFEVDSDTFTNSPNFPTRGYDIDQTSFALTMGATTIGLQSPFPAGQTPYFVIRNDDPAVDGFFTATSLDFPLGVPVNQTGIFGQFLNNYSVTYVGTTLTSLDILDALGTYDFTGLTVFNWTIDDGPFNPLIIDFAQMTIECAPPPAVSYCTAGTSANGCQATLSAAGVPSASAPSGFVVSAATVEGNRNGLFFWSTSGRQATPWGNGSSYRCTLPPNKRGGVQASGGTPGGCNGSASQDLNARWQSMPAQNPGAGAMVQIQYWYRDPMSTSNQPTSFSDALETGVCP